MHRTVIHLDKSSKQFQQRRLLCLRPCVKGVSGSVRASSVGYADAVCVVAETVAPWLRYGASTLNRPVDSHKIMVAYALPAPGLVPGIDIGSRHVPSLRRGGGVYYYVIDVSGHCNNGEWLGGSPGPEGGDFIVRGHAAHSTVGKGTNFAHRTQVGTMSVVSCHHPVFN